LQQEHKLYERFSGPWDLDQKLAR